MKKVKSYSSPLLFSRCSSHCSIINIENRGAFFEKLGDLLQAQNIQPTKKTHNSENIILSNGECAYVIDFHQNKILFKKGFKDFLGYDEKEITIDRFGQLYHPDDYEITSRVYKAAILYCLDYPEDCSDSTLFISFRIRRKNGSNIKVLSKATIYEMDENGKIISALVKFTNISFLDKTTNVNWDFKTRNFMKNFFKEQVYKAYQDIFTKRETRIIFQINKGLSNKEIAEELNISGYTVATHRKNIFKKAKCHGPQELITFCKGKGIL